MQTDRELLLRLMIADAAFLTTKEKRSLQEAAESPQALAAFSLDDLSLGLGRSFPRARWDGKQALLKAKRALQIMQAFSIGCVFQENEDFPALLREMPDSPYVLFYRGNLGCLQQPCVSVVGTRRATMEGRSSAAAFSRAAAENGCTVVSGLAYGIDVAAHKGALQAEGGATAALLASGIDTITPASHTPVARSIIERGGCIVSEYTPGTPAQAFRFIQRDRLIAALSPATVVIQAPSGSGALLTAGFALEYSRDVIFHAAAFSEESKLLERNNREKLHLALEQGRNVSYKIENSPEKYVSDGAPVIHNFAEFCACMQSAPGTSFCKKDDRQISLF